jgi:hypothetical protein
MYDKFTCALTTSKLLATMFAQSTKSEAPIL